MSGFARARVAFTVLAAQLQDRPERLLVTIGAIALGIALSVSVTLVNASAADEFGRASRALTGSADLVIDGGRGGFDEALYPSVARRPEVTVASPVLETELALAAGGTLMVLGVDPFLAGRLEPAIYGDLASHFTGLLGARAIVLSAAAATTLNVGRGGTLRVRLGREERLLEVIDVLPSSAYPRPLGVMDLGSAQWTLLRLGRLSRLELRLAPGVDPARFGASLALPAGALIARGTDLEGRGASLRRAYYANLDMLALVALLTGGFLVFATQALSTLRRRAQFALLRALGVTRAEVTLAVVLEGALVGLAGGILGTALGWVIAREALARFGGDLGAGYAAGPGTPLAAPATTLVAFVALGVLVSALSSWLPARRVAALAPARALKGGDPEFALATSSGGRRGAGLLIAGGAIAFAPPLGGLPLAGYLSIALLLFGAVLLVPSFARLVLAHLPTRVGPIGRLALAQLQGTVAESAVSLAAIVVSFSLMVSMAIMVHSFRDSFERWLGGVLPADVYLRVAPGSDTVLLSDADGRDIAAIPGVERAELRRVLPVLLAPDRPAVALIARRLDAVSVDRLPLLERASATPADLPAVYVSEAVHDLYRVGIGSRLTLPVGGQGRAVVVAGIWRDYARSSGTILIEQGTYRAWSHDVASTDAALWLKSGASAALVGAELTRRLKLGASLELIETSDLKARSLTAFDRAFTITYLLEAIAVAIGLAGVGFAFASTALARRAEFGVLRHLGCSARQLKRLLAGEGALVGALGALYGLLVGGLLSLVLVYVVNRQSFHWSLDFVVPVGQLLLVALALVLAAATTARLAARGVLGTSAVRAAREDW